MYRLYYAIIRPNTIVQPNIPDVSFHMLTETINQYHVECTVVSLFVFVCLVYVSHVLESFGVYKPLAKTNKVKCNGD